ncbi:uncharacterized protein LOC106712054 [Papilio machaon]|uniref:uncharacterized protein LOC106712054 n=1 Tax=Papilio machaon TaxID=76193 RepID=UPI001E6632CB|nr:uncharacterized protein LOC106712054 [Papilio machaon]
MEQLYMLEMFIDKVTVFVSDDDEKSTNNKKLIIKIKFGPNTEFIIKEGQLAVNEGKDDDVIDVDESGRKKWTRTIRVGKSYLFPSYPDTLLVILSKFPLEIEVWNDDDTEINIFVGVGTMYWQTEFFHMLKETADICKVHEPLTIKENARLLAECHCKQVGEISFILRLSALGNSIITEFQQPMRDPDSFVFRTNKAPSMFECKRIEGDDPNFCMVGSLYETTTLEDPDVIKNAVTKIEICTEASTCGMDKSGPESTCKHGEKDKRPYPIDKIRMGDIRGPCGNPNCPLAHKVKTYIRNLDSYKNKVGVVSNKGDNVTKKICGKCDCKDDRWHRESCPLKKEATVKVECEGCKGVTEEGETCEDKKKKLMGTGATPKGSKTQVNYLFSTIKFQGLNSGAQLRNDFIQNSLMNPYLKSDSTNKSGCSCSQEPTFCDSEDIKYLVNQDMSMEGQEKNLETDDSKCYINVYNCVVVRDEKDCSCNPPKPTPLCRTFDCECMSKMTDIASRKNHKPFCPLYKHKSTCPVTKIHEEETQREDDEDEAEPLPYGLPPISLGPCPIMGRPCSVPDGFAKMYKNAALPALPPSYSDAGKVCCSKEYERVKKALQEYMKYEKDHDYRCVNKFDVDTERRCCDKEQHLMALMGKGCCGAHKMAIQEKFNEKK